MFIPKTIRFIAACSFLFVLSADALADDRDRDRDEDRDRTTTQDTTQLREELRKSTNLTDQDFEVISSELDEYARRTRDREEISELVRSSLNENCMGECLREVIDSMNEAVEKGASPQEARTMVSEALRNERMERKDLSGRELGERVKERVESSIRKMEQDRERDRTREMDREHRDRDGSRDGLGTGTRGGMGTRGR
jgi:hypothetical protein